MYLTIVLLIPYKLYGLNTEQQIDVMRRDSVTKSLLEISIYHQDTVWPRFTRCGNEKKDGICDEYRLNFHIQGCLFWHKFRSCAAPNWRKCCLVFRPRLTKLSITGHITHVGQGDFSKLSKLYQYFTLPVQMSQSNRAAAVHWNEEGEEREPSVSGFRGTEKMPIG